MEKIKIFKAYLEDQKYIREQMKAGQKIDLDKLKVCKIAKVRL